MNNTYIPTTKWLDLYYHFIQDCLEKNNAILYYILGLVNLANILTKSLTVNCFIKLQNKLLLT